MSANDDVWFRDNPIYHGAEEDFRKPDDTLGGAMLRASGDEADAHARGLVALGDLAPRPSAAADDGTVDVQWEDQSRPDIEDIVKPGETEAMHPEVFAPMKPRGSALEDSPGISPHQHAGEILGHAINTILDRRAAASPAPAAKPPDVGTPVAARDAIKRGYGTRGSGVMANDYSLALGQGPRERVHEFDRRMAGEDASAERGAGRRLALQESSDAAGAVAEGGKIKAQTELEKIWAQGQNGLALQGAKNSGELEKTKAVGETARTVQGMKGESERQLATLKAHLAQQLQRDPQSITDPNVLAIITDKGQEVKFRPAEKPAGKTGVQALPRPGQAAAGVMSAQDQQALEWARANSKDARAAAILQRLGAS
jgi:hypothetical protein